VLAVATAAILGGVAVPPKWKMVTAATTWALIDATASLEGGKG
jgi:hypothetical protein